MAQYSLFVLKVQLNNKQANKERQWTLMQVPQDSEHDSSCLKLARCVRVAPALSEVYTLTADLLVISPVRAPGL